ncbi:c-type cytochrome [Flavobacterium sp. '19STA2R22 D10 B1']|uniref:c-type cytochrome n=1 Tax=Flavobacterium aerium TaxID=3037261 RepID=UPI00278BF47B|nr:cytochrome c [Flavobacterium sp. '19STA2R22 D10 B1']
MNSLFIFLQANATPVPKDIPLELPLPEWMLVIILVISFLLHIVFVNLMLGGSILTLWAEIKGLRNKEYDTLAYEIAKTTTVNKSIAVVLGVAPLLSINVLYTIYFYSANALTGLVWIAVIPLVSIAFLLTYLHKYTWKLLEHNKALHISILGLAVLIFLFIPLIFLTNINLMLFPEKWAVVKGFMSALTLPNVFPRYLHFLLASLSVTGLFLFWYMSRKNYPFEKLFFQLTRYDIQKKGYSLALMCSIGQFMIGPIVLLTLPSKGIGWNLILVILAGASIALPAMFMMWKGLLGAKENIGKNFYKVAILMSITVLFMGSGRQIYRANALEKHQELVHIKTEQFQKIKKEAIAKRKQLEKQGNTAEISTADKGKKTFNQYCASCHKPTEKLVGPPVTEMASIYKDNSAGLKSWIKNPGKKRADYPQMPGFQQLSEDKLSELSEYILTLK